MLTKRVRMALIDTKGLEPFAPIIAELYKDIAQPTAKNFGLAFGAITSIGLFLHLLTSWGTDRLNLRLKHNLEQYAERLKDIPEEQIIEPPLEVALPIIEKLSYVSNNEIQSLYIELLTKASIKELNNQAHPSFVNIINNLSPDEAILLKDVYTNKSTAIPCIEARLYDSKKKSSKRLTPYYSEYDNNSELAFNENASAYISNLIGLGILQYSDMVLKKTSIYEKLEKKLNDELETAKSQLNEFDLKYFIENRELRLKKMQVFITPFGELFLKAIMPQLIDITEETP